MKKEKSHEVEIMLFSQPRGRIKTLQERYITVATEQEANELFREIEKVIRHSRAWNVLLSDHKKII